MRRLVCSVYGLDELGQWARELDPVVMENKGKWKGGWGTAGQLVRVKLGMRKAGKREGGGAEGEFLRELHSLDTSTISGAAVGGSKQELIRVGGREGAANTKKVNLAPETLRWSGK